MNWQPPQLSPEMQHRLADVLELFIKLAGALGIGWAFVARVWKPYREWRNRQLTAAICKALEPELKLIKDLAASGEKVNGMLLLSLERQNQVFDELDLFVLVVADLRDRADETNELLDVSGLAVRDRRRNGDRRQQAEDALAELQGRLRARRRREDDLRNLEDRPS